MFKRVAAEERTRVTTRLVAIMAIPALAFSLSITTQLRHEFNSRANAVEVGRRATHLQALSNLNVALRAESSTAFIIIGARHFNVPISLGPLIIGIDVPITSAQNRDDVDSLIDSLGSESPITHEQVNIARRSVDDPQFDNLESKMYAVHLETLQQNVARQLAELRSRSGSVGADQDMINAQFATEHAMLALTNGLDQTGPIVGFALGVKLSTESSARLAASTRLLRDELRMITNNVDLPKTIRRGAETILESSANRFLTDRANAANSTANSAMSPEARRLFKSAKERSEALAALAKLSSSETAKRADILAKRADSRINWTIGFLVSAWILSIFAALLVARPIARALRRFEQRAFDLVQGDASSEPLPETGPRELALMAKALNQLVHEYELLGRQTEALANGQLDHDHFANGAHGPLGQVVQDAVHRLVDEMQRSEHTKVTLKRDAIHDPLTDLYNRAGIVESLQAALSEKRQCTVIFIDLDWFKEVNDRFGHSSGDEVLRQVGRRLKENLRDGDIVGRLGGDEFVMVCAGSACEGTSSALAQRIVDAIAKPFAVHEQTIFIGASVGVARALDTDDVTTILARADQSLYAAKALGKGCVSVSDATNSTEPAVSQ